MEVHNVLLIQEHHGYYRLSLVFIHEGTIFIYSPRVMFMSLSVMISNQLELGG